MNSSPVLESSIEPVAVAELRPIQERERIASLDVLRGVALLGILAMNIRSFASPFAAYSNPLLVYEYSGASRFAFWATTLVFDTKMMSIFSMLFGAGALVYGAKELGGKTSPTRLWYRRNFWLLVIGLIHGYLIWEGDILVIYSLCALLFLWWTRKLPAWALVLLSAVMFAIGGLLTIAHAVYFDDLTAEEQAEELAVWEPSAEDLAEEMAVHRDGYLEIVMRRAPNVFVFQTAYFLAYFLWRSGGMMVLGQALMKWGVLTGVRTRSFYWAMALAGYLVGFPLVWMGMQQLEAIEFAVPQRFSLDLYNYFGSIAVALGHVGLVLWLLRTYPDSLWFGRLAAVGRMALTNYLMQSLIGTTLFYGYGFNLFGRMDYAWQLLVVVGVWALQLIVCPWWLRHFQFGPIEWLWRWLTYGVRPPMLLKRAPNNMG